MKTAPLPGIGLRLAVVAWSEDFDRKCSGCGNWEPASAFPVARRNKAYPPRGGRCKGCENVRHAARWRRAHPVARPFTRINVVAVSDDRNKRCSRCEAWKPAREFYNQKRSRDGKKSACKSCSYAYDASESRARYLARTYAIAQEVYEAMHAAQDGRCGVCGGGCPTGRSLAVDHDHATGEIRGLLCQKCNTGLGLLGDTPDAMLRVLSYLRGAR